MHESAPTSLYRDRKLNDKGKAKIKVKDEKRKIKEKGKGKASEAPSVMEVDSGSGSQSQSQSINLGVKAEPISPTKPSLPLDPNEGVPPPGGWRDDDAMMSDDEEQDRDQDGRRVRAFAETGGNDSEDEDDVNEAQRVDLSESEEEEEEDDLTADFTQVEGEVSSSSSAQDQADSHRRDQKTSCSCFNSQTCSPNLKIRDRSTQRTNLPLTAMLKSPKMSNQMSSPISSLLPFNFVVRPRNMASNHQKVGLGVW